MDAIGPESDFDLLHSDDHALSEQLRQPTLLVWVQVRPNLVDLLHRRRRRRGLIQPWLSVGSMLNDALQDFIISIMGIDDDDMRSQLLHVDASVSNKSYRSRSTWQPFSHNPTLTCHLLAPACYLSRLIMRLPRLAAIVVWLLRRHRSDPYLA